MSRLHLMRRLLDVTRGSRPALIASTAAAVVGRIADIALLALAAASVATLFEEAPSLRELLLPLAIIALVRAVALYLEQYSGHAVAFRLLAEMRTDFYRRVEPLAPASLADQRSGDLISRVISDVDRIEAFFAHTIAPAVSAVLVSLIVLVMVFVMVHPGAALLLFPAFALIGLGIPVAGARLGGAAAQAARETFGRLSALITDGIQGIRDVIIFGYRDRRVEDVTAEARAGSEAESDLAGVSSVRAAANSFVIGLTTMGIFAVSMDLHADGHITMPVVVGVTAATFTMFRPLTALQELIPALDNALASAARIFEITDRTPGVSDPPQPGHPGHGHSLDYQRVGFAYVDGHRVLEDVTLAVPSRSRVAVIGPSGSGKSTLVSLALRFWDPDRGQVGIGGADVRRMSLTNVRRQLAVVTQDTYLFNDTIAANLRIADPTATDEELDAVTRAAGVHDFVTSLSRGFDTMVGELGSRLSGGQRQRLAIARALLADAPLLILDEATSDLDATTQDRVLQTLKEVSSGKTTLMIAHRLETIRDADEIVILDRGKIVERGTHSQLLRLGGVYAHMLRRERDLIDR